MESEIRFPDVTVQLSGVDGNVFNLIGKVRKALIAKATKAELDEFSQACFESGSYDALFQVLMGWVNVE